MSYGIGSHDTRYRSCCVLLFLFSRILFSFLQSWVEILKLFTKECKHGCFRIATAGHTAHVINHKMLVFFGYGGPEHGFLNIVQEFNFNTKKWRIVPLTGAIFYGTYGHFSVYDPKSGLVFMYGGYTQTLLRQYSLTAQMLSYDPVKSQFKVLKAAPAPRFLHSGVLFDRTILVFGGNPHDESSSGRSAPCYAGDFYAYDIECDSWQLMTQPVIPYSRVRLPRFGHSGLIFKDQIYFFGGFQGILLNDVLRYTPGRCQFLDRREKCLFTGRLGRKCAWSERTKQCIEADKMLPGFEYVKCANADSRSPEEDDVLCSAFKSCHNCLSNSVKCQWCKGMLLFHTSAVGKFCGPLLYAVSFCPVHSFSGTLCELSGVLCRSREFQNRKNNFLQVG